MRSKEGDMWSLGMLLYVLLNGKEPSISQANVFQGVENKLSFIPNMTPLHLSNICAALLRSDPFRRPTITQIIQECMFSLNINSNAHAFGTNTSDKPENAVLTTPLPISPVRPKSARDGMVYNNQSVSTKMQDGFGLSDVSPSPRRIRPKSAMATLGRYSLLQYADASPAPPGVSSPRRRRPNTARAVRSKKQINRQIQLTLTYSSGRSGNKTKIRKVKRSPYRPPLKNPRVVQLWVHNSTKEREWVSIVQKAKCILEERLMTKSLNREQREKDNESLTIWFKARSSIISVVTPQGYVYR